MVDIGIAWRSYLSTLHCKRHSEKNESDHGGAARRASSGMAFVIETKSLPPHVRDGLIEGPVVDAKTILLFH